MKFSWLVALVLGFALLMGGMTVHGVAGTLLMFAGMFTLFASVALFVLGEYENQES